jgi:uncharacterized protein (TIGR02271 family)
MASRDEPVVVQVFRNTSHAEQAIADLLDLGLREEQVIVASRDSELGNARASIPPDGVEATLRHLQVPEERARYYQREAEAGRTVLAVAFGNQLDAVRKVLRAHADYGLDAERAGEPEPATSTMQLREERLIIEKDVHTIGEVVLRKVVEQIPQQVEVDATHDEVEVEYVSVGEVVKQRRPPWFEDDVLVIPVYEEQLVVTRQIVMREQVRVRRSPVTERHILSDALRRENAVVEDPQQTGRVTEHLPSQELEPLEEAPGAPSHDPRGD